MSEAHTDCPPCPWCGASIAAPQMSDEAGHSWDGRHRTYDPRALWCCACGCAWIEGDLDAVARAWRAQAAWEVARDPAAAAPPGITRNGTSHARKA